jgi:hypothetical protein
MGLGRGSGRGRTEREEEKKLIEKITEDRKYLFLQKKIQETVFHEIKLFVKRLKV